MLRMARPQSCRPLRLAKFLNSALQGVHTVEPELLEQRS